ncbi:Kynureninase (L-kynurenine hydrolase) [Physocladia obscura]|uniref:Kynureninase n=1 Tax=Physocladia obscura TaxID=109957 RepID=A0AAD5T7Q6_9FUNG|nr:Kynureninase (L-kynurenine hydrolase) [Physocladia obscura]
MASSSVHAPLSKLRSVAAAHGLSTSLASAAFAVRMDSELPAVYRADFSFPHVSDITKNIHPSRAHLHTADAVYMIGNSLGLMPVATRRLINEELDVWSARGVNGHFDHPHNRPWVSVDDNVLDESARIVGANRSEIAIMNTLTSNLHFLLISFYHPTPTRFKIVMEAKAFPSDAFAFASQVQFHGFKATDAIVEIAPRDGEFNLRIEDIIATIEREGDSVALVLFSGVQYYTGQFFDLKRITDAGHAVGARVGFDLAHAVGNVPLSLHDWDVDFAAWCTYKYLNGGPGNIGGAFVHSKHDSENLPRFAGWWGSDPTTKFTMDNQFHGIPGAAGYRVSNPSVLATTSLLGSLQTFAKTSMYELRARSLLLTAYLEYLLQELDVEKPGVFRIITPSDPEARGSQLSILFVPGGTMERVFDALLERGVVTDERRPDVIRISPVPLYCTFLDVFKVYEALKEVI